jgi:asparagine synthase (glutamine-hydrolysing)
MKVTIGVLSKEGKNVADKILDVLKSFDVAKPLHFGLIAPDRSLFDKNLALLSKQSAETSTIAGYATTQSITSSMYDFLQLDDSAFCFEGKVYAPIPGEYLIDNVTKEPHKCEAALQTLVEQADGDYMFMLLKEGWILAGRDPIGVQALYFGESRDLVALATNRKALWRLGITNPISFPPGNIGFMDKQGFKFKTVKSLTYNKPNTISIDEAAIKLQTLLQESIHRRIHGVKEVAVAFSGGLDSSIVAFLASKAGIKVNLLHVSMENEIETEGAIEAAEALDLPLKIDLFKESDVAKTLPRVVDLTEDADPVKASIGLSFYWIAEIAAEAGYKVLLAGQGADELFGGYQRYVAEYCKNGGEKAIKNMFKDVVHIHESNLERDAKITSFHDVDLRLPFGYYDLVEFAVSLPIECKMELKADTLRKLVLRKVALNMGVPDSIALKPKKAVQYSTGINDAVKRIAKKQGKTVNDYINELFEQSRSKQIAY